MHTRAAQPGGFLAGLRRHADASADAPAIGGRGMAARPALERRVPR